MNKDTIVNLNDLAGITSCKPLNENELKQISEGVKNNNGTSIYKYLDINYINDYYIEEECLNSFIPENEFDYNKFILKQDDILISSVITRLRFNIKIIIIPTHANKIIPPNNYYIIRPKKNIHTKYIKLFLESYLAKEQLKNIYKKTQSESRALRIKKSDLEYLKLPLFDDNYYFKFNNNIKELEDRIKSVNQIYEEGKKNYFKDWDKEFQPKLF